MCTMLSVHEYNTTILQVDWRNVCTISKEQLGKCQPRSSIDHREKRTAQVLKNYILNTARQCTKILVLNKMIHCYFYAS